MSDLCGIIVFGANGSGKTTLGRELARILNFRRMDMEDYYFRESEIPYSDARSKDEVIKLMLADIEKYRSFVISGVTGDYGDVISQYYKLAVYMSAPHDLRMKRVKQRVYDMFGERVNAGGDMYEQEQKFFDFVASRPLSKIDQWAETLSCPIIHVDGTIDWRVNAENIRMKWKEIEMIENTKENYTDINSRKIDSWVEDGWEWSIPISHEDYIKAKSGQWSVLLTPSKPVPAKWFTPFLQVGRLNSVKLLGLASGGGQQMPVFAALGADCTVLDYSQKQLDNEYMVSEREDYPINIIRADMTKRLPFEDESFDIIFHPVSNCYVEDVYHIWNECFRVLKKGGVLLAGMNYGLDYLVEEDNPRLIVNKLPYNPLKDRELYKKNIQNGDEDYQFSHTIEEQIGGQLKAGLVLTDLYEDTDNEGVGEYIPNYIATRAVKPC